MKIMDFLFGKKPNIFDKNKEVRHKLNTFTWQEWKNRYLNDPEYDWKRHEGTHFQKNNSSDSQNIK